MVAPALHYPRQEWQGMPHGGPSDDPGILARILYRLRQESGLTQEDVAEAAGWPRDNTAISKLERGRTRLPRKEKIADLERAFGVPPGYIENQLPRREKMMMAEPDRDSPYPMGPLPRISAHVRDIEALDDSGRFVLALEQFVLNLKEQAMKAAREDRSDSEPDSMEPTA